MTVGDNKNDLVEFRDGLSQLCGSEQNFAGLFYTAKVQLLNSTSSFHEYVIQEYTVTLDYLKIIMNIQHVFN